VGGEGGGSRGTHSPTPAPPRGGGSTDLKKKPASHPSHPLRHEHYCAPSSNQIRLHDHITFCSIVSKFTNFMGVDFSLRYHQTAPTDPYCETSDLPLVANDKTTNWITK